MAGIKIIFVDQVYLVLLMLVVMVAVVMTVVAPY
jgi:hypothetical protein